MVAALLVQRMQARGWLPATRVLALRAFQLFFLALFFFNVGPASTVSLLACYVAAALPGRKWYFRQSKQTRFALTAACAVLSVIWAPVSFVVMPSITDDVAFCAIFQLVRAAPGLHPLHRQQLPVLQTGRPLWAVTNTYPPPLPA